MAEEKQVTEAKESSAAGKIGLFGLIGIVVSSCIGSGAFALTGQLANVASPGPALIAWLIVGAAFLCLALTLKNLVDRRPDLNGIFDYAIEGFGPFAGFLSGWGYWLSAWVGNVAFAVAMMSAVGYFYEPFQGGNSVMCIVIASIVLWGITFLVVNGVESASFINAVVMIAKVAALALFIIVCLVFFSSGVLTADFWGTVHDNLVALGSAEANSQALGTIPDQIANCLIVMMWCFIGIEGASVVSSRAKSKSQAGQATIIGLIALLVIYVGVSVLPFGTMPYTEIAQMSEPAMIYVMNNLVGPWGGAFISIAMIVSVLGCWLSFTILPAETTQLLAQDGLVPSKWGEVNKKNAPAFSLYIVGACTQAFLITLLFTDDAYNFAVSLCTVAIVVTWVLASGYGMKYCFANGQTGYGVAGLIATAFLIIATLLSGWTYLLLTCIGYVPGIFVYMAGRKEHGKQAFNGAEKAIVGLICCAAVAGIVLLATGVIPLA